MDRFRPGFNFLDGGFVQMTTAAEENGTDVPHERLAMENLVISKPGYVYIYYSNEDSVSAPVEVFFACPDVTQSTPAPT